MIRGARRRAALVLIASALAGFGCRRSSQARVGAVASASAALPSASSGLTLDAREHDFGPRVQGDLAEHVFELANAGPRRLELERKTEALGCVGVIEPPVLEPGARARFAVTCQLEYYGPLRVTLALRASSTSATLAEVELRGSVTPLLAFDAPLLSLRVPFGEERSADIHLSGALLDRARLTLEDPADPGLSVALIPAQPGAPAGLRFRVKGRKVGTHAGNVSVRTQLPRPSELSLPYSYDVTGNLEITPSTPYFDLRAPGAHRVAIHVHSTRSDFVVRAVRVANGPFSASFAREANGGYEITATALRDPSVGDARGTLGRLLIVSNDRAEPEKEVSLFAFGALN